jgi:hypothetical protein
MRKYNLFRSVLAVGAVLAVAGPGLVLAGTGLPNYAPRILQVIGPSSVPVNGSGTYTARVTFTDGSVVDFSGDPVTCTAARGSITPGFNYTAPATSGRDSIRCTLTHMDVTVTGTKIILNP